MIATFDVSYENNIANAAGIVFDTFQSATTIFETIKTLPVPNDYVAGQFYRRELPCILNLLDEINAGTDAALSTIIVDG